MVMSKLLLLALIMICPLVVKSQDTFEVPAELSIPIGGSKKKVLVYPLPIIDQFRVDLRDFKKHPIKLEIVRNEDLKVFYSKDVGIVKSNTMQLSAYAIGLTKGTYTLRLIANGYTYSTPIKLD